MHVEIHLVVEISLFLSNKKFFFIKDKLLGNYAALTYGLKNFAITRLA